MGCISSTTYNGENAPQRNLKPTPRQPRKSVNEVTKGKGIPLVEYIPPLNSGLSKIYLRSLLELQNPHILPCNVSLDMLWHLSYLTNSLRPNWSGLMTDVSVGDYPGKSTIYFLPILDMDPNDPTCIYSDLLFISKQAEFLNIETHVITFDQPLWLKALDIFNAKLMQIVLILGGFHLMMSFLGSIDSLMKGSGLKNALQTIYGRNTVEHMISGKAVSRALRGHFLTESALTTKLLRDFLLHDVVQTEVTKENNAEDCEILEVEVTEKHELGNSEIYPEFFKDMNEWMKCLESELTKLDVEELKVVVTSAMHDTNTVDFMSNSKEYSPKTYNT